MLIGKKMRSISFVLFCMALFQVPTIPAHSNLQTRTTVDRPDDVTGHQIHLVYVVPKGSGDSNLDLSGHISAWTRSANSWLKFQVGKEFIYDTYQGEIDITFLQSSYTVSELCYDNCDTLAKLMSEFRKENTKYSGLKTTMFVTSEILSDKYCGWATSPGNTGIVSKLFQSGCSQIIPDALNHEIMHTYGIGHTCFSTGDLMLGGECPLKRYVGDQVTIDAPKAHYISTDNAFGIDLLRMPIWSDGSGDKEYARVKPTSGDKYLPQLRSGQIYAIVGETSGKFAWEWEDNFWISEAQIECRMSVDSREIVGKSEKSSCIFDVPNNWRVGSGFLVSQTWAKGPWHGNVSVNGILVRTNFSSSACEKNICFVGGSMILPNSCWKTSSSDLILQELVEGIWQFVDTVPLQKSQYCGDTYPLSTTYELAFDRPGVKIFRWIAKGNGTVRSYVDEPFVVVVSDEEEREATEAEVLRAKELAVQLGKLGDLVPPPSVTSCEITDSGVMCRSAIDFRENWQPTGGETIDWYAVSSKRATNVLDVSGYVDPILISSGQSPNGNSSLFITYGDLAKIANGDENHILIYSMVKTSSGLRNEKFGAGTFLAFEEVKKTYENAIAKAKAEAVAKAKASRTISITCIKGKLTKKVTGKKPSCPRGYVKK
jgi:hypothetical protein